MKIWQVASSTEKHMELREVPDLAKRAEVAVEIGLDVTCVPAGDVPLRMRRHTRTASVQESFPITVKIMLPYLSGIVIINPDFY